MGIERKISIIVPVYNVGKYIEACIQSVKMQTCSNFECIIVDDGSNDGTLDIIHELVDDDCRFKVYHQDNRGVSEARNTAISHATGEYLVFLDGDDLLQQDAVDIVLNDVNDEQPEVILYSMMSYYEKKQSNGNVKKIIVPREWQLSEERCTGSAALKDCIYKNNFLFAVWQTAVSRLYLQNKIYKFKSGIVHEDELWLMRVIGNASKVKMGSKAFYLNRADRVGGITQSHNIQKEYDKCTVIEELQKDLYSKQNEELASLIQQKCAEFELSLIMNYKEYAKDDIDKELVKKIRCNRKRLCKNRNIKYKLVWVLCIVLGVKTTSKLLGFVRGK